MLGWERGARGTRQWRTSKGCLQALHWAGPPRPTVCMRKQGPRLTAKCSWLRLQLSYHSARRPCGCRSASVAQLSGGMGTGGEGVCVWGGGETSSAHRPVTYLQCRHRVSHARLNAAAHRPVPGARTSPAAAAAAAARRPLRRSAPGTWPGWSCAPGTAAHTWVGMRRPHVSRRARHGVRLGRNPGRQTSARRKGARSPLGPGAAAPVAPPSGPLPAVEVAPAPLRAQGPTCPQSPGTGT